MDAKSRNFENRAVVLANDHSIVRQGVVQVLQSMYHVVVVAEADNGLSAIFAVKKHKPNPLMLDAAILMPKRSQ